MYRPNIVAKGMLTNMLGRPFPKASVQPRQVPALLKPVGVFPHHNGPRLIATTNGHDLLPAPNNLNHQG